MLYSRVMPTRVSLSRATSHELLTADEFLDRLEPGVHADLIDGEVSMHSPVSLRHAFLVNFVSTLLTLWIEERNLGTLFREVVAVRLGPRQVFLPDLAFYRRGREECFEPTCVRGAPDFVVEALSQTTAAVDIGPKLSAYELHGVSEYWVLEPQTLAHRFYRREGEIFVEYAEAGSRIESRAIPGFLVERAWLDPDALPRVADALAAIRAGN